MGKLNFNIAAPVSLGIESSSSRASNKNRSIEFPLAPFTEFGFSANSFIKHVFLGTGASQHRVVNKDNRGINFVNVYLGTEINVANLPLEIRLNYSRGLEYSDLQRYSASIVYLLK